MVEGAIIGYIISGINILLVLIAIFIKLTWGKKIKYPKGNKNKFKYNEFEATLIVDNMIKMEGDDFILDGKKINKDVLAKMCAVSMDSVNYTAKIYGPEPLRKNKKLTDCVFVFLSEENYYKKLMDLFGVTYKSAGFSDILKYNMGSKNGPYVCYMQSKYMWEVYNTGYLTVHEYIHCYSKHVSGNWDSAHDLWKYKAVNGKTLQNIAVERIKNKLELDKKLQN